MNEGTGNPTKWLHAGEVVDGTDPPAGLRGLSITGLMANPVPDNLWRAAAVVLAVR
jgi:hypothetical protein